MSDEDEDGRATAVPSPRHRRAGKASPELATGDVVGRYVIRERMAEGGMGVVYVARDPELDREVALKLLRPDGDALQGAARLLREAQAMARLSHPNVVVVHDVGSIGERVFIAMEYVKGQTLRRWLDTRRTPDAILEVFRAAGRGIAAAHAVGIVHRDFKPDNVLVREDGRVAVTDFGLARDAGGDAEAATVPTAGMLGLSVTTTGDLVGTPLYMAPEQHRRQALDARTDQFSFCVALFEAIYDQHPFGDAINLAFLERVLAGEVGRPSERRVPVRVHKAILRGLSPAIADRFPSMDALLAALAPRIQRRWLLAAAAVAALIAAAVIAIVLLRGSSSSETRALHVTRTFQLTRDPDLQLDPALSPDGSRIAFASGRLGKMRIHVRPTAGGRSVELTGSLPGDHRLPRWSADGSRLAFGVGDTQGGGIYVIEPGKAPHPLVPPSERSARMPAWSPDGRWLAYVRTSSSTISRWELIVAAADGSEPRVIATAELPISSLSWSPDQKRLAFSQGNADFLYFGNIAPSSIWIATIAGGPPIQVTEGQWPEHAPIWMPDGKHLLFVSDRDGSRDIYQLEIDEGRAAAAPTRLTTGFHAHTIAMSSDGRQVIASAFHYRSNLWSIPRGDGVLSLANATPLTTGNQIVETVDIGRTGTIVFDSNIAGNQDLFRWVSPTEAVALTDHPANEFAPAVSPDGTRTAFHSFRSGNRDIHVLDHATGKVTQLTSGLQNDLGPRWSPDGTQLAYYSDRSGRPEVWVVAADGGEPRQMTSQSAANPDWRPDGRAITFHDATGIWDVPVDGGAPVQLIADVGLTTVMWSPDGKTLFYRKLDTDAKPVLWMRHGDSPPKQVLAIDGPVRWWVRDEIAVGDTQIIIPLTEYEADLWSIDLAH